MRTPPSELAVRAAALYLPITLVITVAIVARPTRLRLAGATVAGVWNLVSLLAINALAVRWRWWTFGSTPGRVGGVPVDLWIGWTLLWGVVPMLVPRRRASHVVGIGLLLVGADLVLMPLAEPVVKLSPTWLVGEAVCAATCLLPGLLLGHLTERGTHLQLRATMQFVAFAGLLLYVVPSVAFAVTGDSWNALLVRPRWHFVLAAVLTSPVAAMTIQAVREFAVVGGGTPLPLDPPRRLVVTGPYAYLANPMQVGATLILVVWAVLTKSAGVLAAALVAALLAAGVVAWNEYGDLRQRFGDDWPRYRAHVRRWIPRWRPYVAAPVTLFVGASCQPCREVGGFFTRRQPIGLEVAAAESSPTELTRITYRLPGHGDESGLAAVGRGLEHANLAWAVCGWLLRLPVLRGVLQLVADAVGASPRRLGGPG